MTRLFLPLALGAAAIAAAPLSAAEVQIQSAGPVVELQVTETVEGSPDIATISAGVTTQSQTAVGAMQDNAREMTRVVDRIKALGIAEKDIQTTGINLSPRYDYDRTSQQQVFRGYQASNRVSVKLRNVERTGNVLDALVAAGATDIGGPDFSIDDDSAARAQARRTAMENAKTQALEYARWAGYSNVRLLEVSESMAVSPPRPMMRAAMNDAAVESTPVQPGLVGSSVTVSVKYEMVS
jgi:uncharacterized protein YggE